MKKLILLFTLLITSVNAEVVSDTPKKLKYVNDLSLSVYESLKRPMLIDLKDYIKINCNYIDEEIGTIKCRIQDIDEDFGWNTGLDLTWMEVKVGQGIETQLLKVVYLEN